MAFLPSHHFVSDTDTFLRDYLRANPETINRQKEGLRLWWGNQGVQNVLVRNREAENKVTKKKSK
ncbi:MAG: DUF3460 family protein [Burkholderiales bacterium]|nr:DUF3460 family protein [Burkholderiales bacterium]